MASGRSALILAVHEYEDAKLRKLRAPARDAAELKRVLADPEIGDFDVDLCANQPEHLVRRKIARFFADRRRDDLLLLHVSSHGLKDDAGQLFFAATDTEVDHLDATALPAEWVNRQMTNSRSRRIVLLLDCCYSGAFAKGLASRAGEGVEVRERFEGSGRAVLTASSAMEYAFEGGELSGEANPSVFSSAIVKALETGEADRDGDGKISVDELYDYVYDQVQEVTPKQTPGKWIFDVRGDLLIAKSSYVAPVLPADLPAELKAAIESPLPTARLGVVQVLGELLAGRDASLAKAAQEALEGLAAEDDSRRVSEAATRFLHGAAPIKIASGQEPEGKREGTAEGTPVSAEAGSSSAEAASRPDGQQAPADRDQAQPRRPAFREPTAPAEKPKPHGQPRPADTDAVSAVESQDQRHLLASTKQPPMPGTRPAGDRAATGPPKSPPTTAKPSAADRPTPSAATASPGAAGPRGQWLVVGAGRLGRSFLGPVASQLGLTSLLFVAGENTPQENVDRFNESRDRGDGYWVEFDRPSEQTQMLDYDFKTVVDTHVLIDAVAHPRTLVLSTSVGADRLPQIVPVVAEGLRRRSARVSDEGAGRLLILVCENGRSADGLSAAESFRRALELALGPAELSRLAEVPRAVTDVVVPVLGGPDKPIPVGRGTLWIEESDLVHDLLGGSPHARLVAPDEIEALHTRKLYCFNALHCFLAVIGHFAGERTIDRVATDPSLQRTLDNIVNALVDATCRRHGLRPDDTIAGEATAAYGKQVLARLQRPHWTGFDPVARATERLRRGWYLEDGRIDGPLIDSGLVTEPHMCKELVHAVSLCMYCVVGAIRQLEQRFLWLDSKPLFSTPLLDGSVATPIRGTIFAKTSPFGRDMQNAPIMEVFARDFFELDRTPQSAWSTTRVADFLAAPIDRELRVLPRRLGDLRCVIFDLDEGLVATESLLYEITRGLIAEYSFRGRTLSHDEYASYVGTSEDAFFEEMIRTYQIVGPTAGDLVQQREKAYLDKLRNANAESLVKPVFRDVLELLARRNVKMAVSSNASSHRVQATLEHVGLANYFVGCATPDKGMSAKPAPDMLLALQEQLDVQASTCLVVESSSLGIEASIAAGCYALLIVNDYTAPLPVARRGVEVLGNSQRLAAWFERFFESG